MRKILVVNIPDHLVDSYGKISNSALIRLHRLSPRVAQGPFGSFLKTRL